MPSLSHVSVKIAISTQLLHNKRVVRKADADEAEVQVSANNGEALLTMSRFLKLTSVQHQLNHAVTV